jgi:hypothetical protein
MGSVNTIAARMPLCFPASGLRLPSRACDANALNLQQMFLAAYVPLEVSEGFSYLKLIKTPFLREQ